MSPSRQLLVFLGIVALALAFLSFSKVGRRSGSDEAIEDQKSSETKDVVLRTIKGDERAPMKSSRSKSEVGGPPKPFIVDPEKIKVYSESVERNKKGDFKGVEQHYKEQGCEEYARLLRDSLLGDEDALSAVFRAPHPESGLDWSSASSGLAGLFFDLGDSYFADRLSKEAPEVQDRVMKMVLPYEDGSGFPNHRLPVWDDCCPALADLATRRMAEAAEQSVTPKSDRAGG